MEKPRPYRAILIGGLIAGTLDITFAFIFYGLRGSSLIMGNLHARLLHRSHTAIAKAAGAQGQLCFIAEVVKNRELPAGRDRHVSQHILE